MGSCSAPVISWCASARSASTPCAGTCPSTATYFPRASRPLNAVIAHVEDPDAAVPDSARAVLKVLIGTFQALEAQIQALEAEITQRAKADPVARRLMTIPGIGPIAATAITALVPAPEGFRAGRDL